MRGNKIHLLRTMVQLRAFFHRTSSGEGMGPGHRVRLAQLQGSKAFRLFISVWYQVNRKRKRMVVRFLVLLDHFDLNLMLVCVGADMQRTPASSSPDPLVYGRCRRLSLPQTLYGALSTGYSSLCKPAHTPPPIWASLLIFF